MIGLFALLLAATMPADTAIPRYQHIFVIVEENKDYARIVGSSNAPVITRLAKTYGSASQFFAETHPSEPNYVAMIGGSTYGIRDDDAFYCTPNDSRPYCTHSDRPGYVNHTIDGPSLATQLEAAGLSWKNYEESLPAPGSLAVVSGYYASKHSGFVNFASVAHDPQRADHLVGFDVLEADLHAGRLLDRAQRLRRNARRRPKWNAGELPLRQSVRADRARRSRGRHADPRNHGVVGVVARQCRDRHHLRRRRRRGHAGLLRQRPGRSLERGRRPHSDRGDHQSRSA